MFLLEYGKNLLRKISDSFAPGLSVTQDNPSPLMFMQPIIQKDVKQFNHDFERIPYMKMTLPNSEIIESGSFMDKLKERTPFPDRDYISAEAFRSQLLGFYDYPEFKDFFVESFTQKGVSNIGATLNMAINHVSGHYSSSTCAQFPGAYFVNVLTPVSYEVVEIVKFSSINIPSDTGEISKCSLDYGLECRSVVTKKEDGIHIELLSFTNFFEGPSDLLLFKKIFQQESPLITQWNMFLTSYAPILKSLMPTPSDETEAPLKTEDLFFAKKSLLTYRNPTDEFIQFQARMMEAVDAQLVFSQADDIEDDGAIMISWASLSRGDSVRASI